MSIEDVNFKPNSFDTIIMIGNNFSLFGGFKKARIEEMKKILRGTGWKVKEFIYSKDPHYIAIIEKVA